MRSPLPGPDEPETADALLELTTCTSPSRRRTACCARSVSELRLEAGQTLGIVGESGSGKSVSTRHHAG